MDDGIVMKSWLCFGYVVVIVVVISCDCFVFGVCCCGVVMV